MKQIAVLGLALGLASCYSLTESDDLRLTPQGASQHLVLIRPAVQTLSNPPVVTTRNVLAYHTDLVACRESAARSLGSKGDTDDVAALKRALSERPAASAVSVKYQSDDPAVVRDRVVKTCLSKRGYVLRE